MLRRRRMPPDQSPSRSTPSDATSDGAPQTEAGAPSSPKDAHEKDKLPKDHLSSARPGPVVASSSLPSYDCAQDAIIQSLAAVFLVAFLGAWYQNEGLMGDHGLQPARATFWEPLQSHFASSWDGFVHCPSVYWWIPLSDDSMYVVIVIGILISTLILVTGQTTWLWQLLLWLLYFSIVSLAGATSFYSYGWESQILETAFLSIFLCPLPGRYHDGRLCWGLWPSTTPCPPTAIPRWLFRWLIFRITLGAGLIKLRGSSCWAHRTCLYYHFETQPIPSPLSFVYHNLPRAVQRRMIDVDLLVQVYTCWFVLVPPIGRVGRWVLRLGGFMQIGLMVGIILSGNFAFLNHLTIIPALACLDDNCWPAWWRQWRQAQRPNFAIPWVVPPPLWRRAADICLLLTIGYLSWPVVSNLWGKEGQVMNGSFDPFRLVNTYGAFGSVGEARYEAIVAVSPNGTHWTEIEFPCKPGNIYRRPCFCAPYHYRLDWNIWFIGFKPHQSMLQRREKWLYHLLAKILAKDDDDERRPWLNLLDSTSANYLQETYYRQGNAPKYIKVDMYHYRMTAGSLGARLFSTTAAPPVAWWNRTLTEPLIPAVQWNATSKRLQQARLREDKEQ